MDKLKDENIVIYNNIYKFLEYRKIKPITPQVKDDIFLRNFNHNGYVSVEGMLNNKVYHILFIERNNDMGLKAKDFNKKVTEISRGKSMTIIVISKEELSKNIKKEILSIRTINRLVVIENYKYDTFVLVIPEHEAVPKHSIATQDELKVYLDFYNLNGRDLQKIFNTDPAVVWLGANVGDIVKIDRISDSTGISTAFRIVVRNK